jgi:hypothetical protein
VQILNNDWAGIYTITGVTTDTFTIASRIIRSTAGAEGTVRRVVTEYASFRTNRGQWPTLAPGSNYIVVTVGGNVTEDATIAWEYYEHYA